MNAFATGAWVIKVVQYLEVEWEGETVKVIPGTVPIEEISALMRKMGYGVRRIVVPEEEFIRTDEEKSKAQIILTTLNQIIKQTAHPWTK